MTNRLRTACMLSVVALAVAPAMTMGAQPGLPAAEAQTQAPQGSTPTPGAEGPSSEDRTTLKKSLLAEEGPVSTDWTAQFESLRHALVRLPIALLLSTVLAFRPRRRGTPPRQAPVIQTQIILAIVGSIVMLVVGASLARAFGIVGAAGLIRYRAKVEDPKDAGVMLSTLAIGLASGVGLYLFAAFATVFVLGVLWAIESIDPAPYALFDLEITAKDSASVKEGLEGVLRRRRIPFELRSTSADAISYEVKMPLQVKTDAVSDALMNLHPEREINVKWEQKKDIKT